MNALKHITPPQWMTQRETQAVMHVIGGTEPPFQSLFVGGCVRNLLLGMPVDDIDIATMLEPHDVMTRLAQAGVTAIPTGLAHGTITARAGDYSFEITTLRADLETDGRHAKIAFTDNWLEDAKRRDFTINTLLADCQGGIYDPLGVALNHLERRAVLFVGDPYQRIREDHLRILRFFRFLSLYGAQPADASALEACRIGASLIKNLSRERVTQEILKILATPTPGSVWMLMKDNGIMIELIDKGFKPEKLNHLCAVQDRHDSKDVLTRLILSVGGRVDGLENYLTFSNAQKNQMALILKAQSKMQEALSEKTLRECVYRFGNAQSLQAYFLLKAQNDQPEQPEHVDLLKYWHAPVFPVTGDDLIKQGHNSGPELGMLLKSMEEEWIRDNFKKLS